MLRKYMPRKVDRLVQIFDPTERLQCVAKYFLSSSSLSIVGKCSGTELNNTERKNTDNNKNYHTIIFLKTQNNNIRNDLQGGGDNLIGKNRPFYWACIKGA